VDARHPLGHARQLADDRQLGIEADVDGRDHLLDAREWRAAQQQDRSVDAAVAQAPDILEAGLADADDAAAQHGARHLRHPAGSLGDAKDLNAGLRATAHHGLRIALDAAEINGDLRTGHSVS
jgi:hypothetical protein